MKKMVKLFIGLFLVLLLASPSLASAQSARDLTVKEAKVVDVLQESIGEDFEVVLYIDEEDRGMFALVPSTPESQMVFLLLLAGYNTSEWDNMHDTLSESSIMINDMFDRYTLAVTKPLGEGKEVNGETELIALFWNGFTVVDIINEDNEDTEFLKFLEQD